MIVQTQFKPQIIHQASQTLAANNYAFIPGQRLSNEMQLVPEQIENFTDCWFDLKQDMYMADGGAYRFRRYGQYNKEKGSENLVQLPHEPYTQPITVNYLNGGTVRHFEPLTESFTSSSILHSLLIYLADICDEARGQPTNWNIRLHPYRILASSNNLGEPTPEGLHRDGVNFIASILINKVNVKGGITTITDDNAKPLLSLKLEHEFDIMLANDEKTMHKVSAISPVLLGEVAYRDVLVVALTAQGSGL